MLGTRWRYLEPVDVGVWRPVVLQRGERLSFYYCSGYRFHRSGGGLAHNDDIAKVGC